MEMRTVLCPVDFSGRSGRELSLARDVCREFGARLVLEHNLDPRPPSFLTVTWMWSEDLTKIRENPCIPFPSHNFTVNRLPGWQRILKAGSMSLMPIPIPFITLMILPTIIP